MKKSLFMIAVTSLMFSNCSHVDYIGTVGNEQEVTATMENEPQQRSSVNDNGYFTWSTGDRINIFTSNGKHVIGKLKYGAGTSLATFTYSIFGDDVEATGFATYPYNSGNSISGSTLTVCMPDTYSLGSQTDNTNAMMVAIPKTFNWSLQFQHMAGLVRFRFRNVPAGVDSFELSLGGKKINGTFKVNLSADNPVINTATTENDTEKTTVLTFDALEEQSDLTLFVPVPAGEYKGLSICLKAGDVVEWEHSSETASNKVSRKSLKVMPTITIGTASGEIDNSIQSAQELQKALDKGGEIKLTQSLDLDQDITVKGSSSLNLNGMNLSLGDHTIMVEENGTLLLSNNAEAVTKTQSSNGSIAGNGDIITAGSGAEITIEEGVALSSAGNCCIFIPSGSENVTVNTAGQLSTNDSDYATIYVNGNVKSATININGGSVTNNVNTAIYAAGKTVLTISGNPYISGTSSVEIRAGKLVVNSGTFDSTGEFAVTENGNGSTTSGVDIAVCQHSTGHELTAEIKGGNFNGLRNVYVSPYGSNTNVTTKVYGGTYTDASAFDYLGNNAKVSLGWDITLDKPITVTADDVTFNLGRYDITAPSCDVFDVTGSLTVNGNYDAVIYAGSSQSETGSVCAVWAHGGGSAVLNGGYYKVGPDKDGNRNDCIYAGSSDGTSGSITINAGKYEYTGPASEDTDKDGDSFLLNCKDNTGSSINVNAGEFKNHVPGYEPTGNGEVTLGSGKAVYYGNTPVTEAHSGTTDKWYLVK